MLLAAVLGALGVALAFPSRGRLRPGRLRAARLAPAWLAVPVAASVLLLLQGTRLALGLIGVGVALGAQRLAAHQRVAKSAEVRSERVQAYCESLAAELAAGQPPHRVLARSAAEFPEFAAVATTAGLGADVPTSLRRLARTPGCDDLRLVAAAWHVAHRSGAGLADALDLVGATVRDRRRTARQVAAELASAHATARLMAALPVLFVLAGRGLGGDPLAFLTSTPFGLGCLASGLALSYAGLAWLQRIADAVVGR